MTDKAMRAVLIVLGILCGVFALKSLTGIGLIGAGLYLAHLDGDNSVQETSDIIGSPYLLKFLFLGLVLTLIVLFFCCRAAWLALRTLTPQSANFIWNTGIILLWFESLDFFVPIDHDRLIANPEAGILPSVLVTAFFVAVQIAGSRRLRRWPAQTPPPNPQEANTVE